MVLVDQQRPVRRHELEHGQGEAGVGFRSQQLVAQGGRCRKQQHFAAAVLEQDGEMSIVATVDGDRIARVAVLRTARKLFDGVVFG